MRNYYSLCYANGDFWSDRIGNTYAIIYAFSRGDGHYHGYYIGEGYTTRKYDANLIFKLWA